MRNKYYFFLMAVICISFTACTARGKTVIFNDSSGIALLIIDIQNEYFEGGKHTLYNPLEALKNAEDILRRFRQFESFPIIHVQHHNSRGAGFFEEGTWGAQIHDNLTPLENEIVITKRQVSSFAGTNLEEVLRERNVKSLVIVGMQTNVCVETTIKDSKMKELGIRVTVLEDACAALNEQTHNSAIERIRDENVFIVKTEIFKGI